MLKTIALIMAYALVTNWMISLSMVAQVAQTKNGRIRFFFLAFMSAIISGCIIYLI